MITELIVKEIEHQDWEVEMNEVEISATVI